MVTLADAVVRARMDTRALAPELRKAGDSSGKAFSAGMRPHTTGMVKGLVASFGLLAGVRVFQGITSEAREAGRVGRLTEAAIRSTGGAAKITAIAAANLAERLSKLSGVDDDLIQSAENVLLTFTKVRNEAGKGNDVFNQGAAAALNMSAALGTDLQGATIQVGKALNDPIKGVSALTRVGVTFTEAQKAQIKQLVATGDQMGAQKVILAELSKEFGGAAKAAADPADKANVAWGNLKEEIGTRFLPMLGNLLGRLTTMATFVGEHIKLFTVLGATIGGVALTIKAVNAVSAAWAAIQSVVAARTVVATAAQWLLNVAMSANPIGIVVLAIAALVAAFVIAWKHSETFRNIIKSTWDGIRVAILGTWHFIRDFVFKPIRDYIMVSIPTAFQVGVTAIKKFWDGLKAVAAAPVKFVIQTVINKGIIGGINWVAKRVHAPTIDEMSLPPGIGDGPGVPRGAGEGPGILGGLGSVLSNPAKWLTDRLSGPLAGIKNRFGNNPLTSVLLGAGNKVRGMAIDKIQSLLSIFDFGAAGSAIGKGAAGIMGLGDIAGLRPGIFGVFTDLRRVFGNVRVNSGYRPGARTLSGNVSYHASGRAIDINPVLGWALYLNRIWGGRLRELITPWNGLNILNGRPHRYTGEVFAQHAGTGRFRGNAHIHAALAGGGVIGEPVFGVGRSGRTYSFGERGAETVVPGDAGAILGRLDEMVRLLAALLPGFDRIMGGSAGQLRQLARAR